LNFSEQEAVIRSLFSFELELKEYSHSVFEGTKQLLAKPILGVDDVKFFIKNKKLISI